MGFETSVSSKGPVAIAKGIREQLGLKPNQKFVEEVKGEKIVLKSLPTLEQLRGGDHLGQPAPRCQRLRSGACPSRHLVSLRTCRASLPRLRNLPRSATSSYVAPRVNQNGIFLRVVRIL